jgi:hypothetical protein
MKLALSETVNSYEKQTNLGPKKIFLQLKLGIPMKNRTTLGPKKLFETVIVNSYEKTELFWNQKTC